MADIIPAQNEGQEEQGFFGKLFSSGWTKLLLAGGLMAALFFGIKSLFSSNDEEKKPEVKEEPKVEEPSRIGNALQGAAVAGGLMLAGKLAGMDVSTTEAFGAAALGAAGGGVSKHGVISGLITGLGGLGLEMLGGQKSDGFVSKAVSSLMGSLGPKLEGSLIPGLLQRVLSPAAAAAPAI